MKEAAPVWPALSWFPLDLDAGIIQAGTTPVVTLFQALDRPASPADPQGFPQAIRCRGIMLPAAEECMRPAFRSGPSFRPFGSVTTPVGSVVPVRT